MQRNAAGVSVLQAQRLSAFWQESYLWLHLVTLSTYSIQHKPDAESVYKSDVFIINWKQTSEPITRHVLHGEYAGVSFSASDI